MDRTANSGYDTVVIDVDGTLLDSNYHHALAWARAFEHVGRTVPVWRIHRHIGMGGDMLVPAVTDQEFADEHGEAVEDRWEKEADEIIEETRLLPAAKELLAALQDRGLKVVLASSSIPKHAGYAAKLLDADKLADAATTADDVDEAKPDPELIDVALDKVNGSRACMVGDSVWDVKAAEQRGLPTIGLLTGGYGRQELLDAGARVV